MRLLSACLLMLLAVNAAGGEARPLDALLTDELRLEGQIKQTEDGHITIGARAFTNANGKGGQIVPPKTKVVVLPKTGKATHWKVGDAVVITGRDGGEGKPLMAREVLLLQHSAIRSTKAHTPAQPAVWPSAQRPTLEFKNGVMPEWKVGNLDIKFEKAGFDYPRRFLPPKIFAFEKTPVFYWILQVRGAGIGGDAAKRFVVRRLLGPQHEFLQFNSTLIKNLPSEGDAARVVFWSSQVDPNWEFMDMDIDTTFGDDSAGKADTKLMLRNVPLPPRGVVPLFAEGTSSFGTHYRITGIHLGEDEQWHLGVAHTQPSQPRDLELSGYSYQADATSGDGKLFWGKLSGITEEIALPLMAGTQIKRLAINFHEESRSMQKRDVILRQCMRFPLRELLRKNPPTPVDKPLAVLAQTQGQPLTVRAEVEGINMGNDKVGAILFAHGTPEDDQHEIRWTFQKGVLRLPGQTDPQNIPIWFGGIAYLWHVDATPKAENETVTLVSFLTPPGVTRGDAELQFEGRAVLDNSFVSTFNLPHGKELVKVRDNDDKTLVLQSIKRLSPGEMGMFPDWISNDWPNAGLVLAFKANPLLGLSDADFIPSCLDAEDDQGRSLQVEASSNNALYLADSRNGAGATYLLFLSEPSASAKSFRLWLSTEEKSHATRQQTIQLKDIMLAGTK